MAFSLNTASNVTTEWERVDVGGDYLVMINATFDGATLAIEQGFKENNASATVYPCAQDTNLSFTAEVAPFVVKLYQNTYVRYVVTDAGASTDIKAKLIR